MSSRWGTCAVALVLLFAGFSRPAAAQINAPDNKGTDFILGAARNLGVPTLRLFIAADSTTQVEITSPGMAMISLTAVGGTTTAVTLPSTRAVDSSNVVLGRGVRVRSLDPNKEIAVYLLNQVSATTDAFTALPVDVLGTEYRATAWQAIGGRPSQILVVGDQASTTITVTTPVAANGFTAGTPRTISLPGGLDAFLIEATAGSNDLTGTLITSDKPVAVFGGHQCGNVPDNNTFACDHMVEQITPVETWASEFVVAPISPRTGGDTVRVLAHEPSTDVFVNGSFVTTLSAGQYYTFNQASTSGAHITTSKPVQVMQFNKGSSADGVTSDPFMMMVVPVNQYSSKYLFSTPPAAPVAFNNWVNIVINGADKAGLKLDGSPLPGATAWTPVIGTTLQYARIQIPIGAHRLEHDSPIVPFGIMVYGHANFDSYGYAGGMRLAPLQAPCVITPTVPGDGQDNDCDQRVDEELPNGIDDDGDNLRDEDLATPPPNSPPVANAGTDQLVFVNGACVAGITVNGLASSDPDGDPLTYSWGTSHFGGPYSGATLNFPSVGPGSYTFALTVTDSKGVSNGPDFVTVVVKDKQPPVLSTTPSVTVVEDQPGGAFVVLPPVNAIDNCGPPAVTASHASGFFPLGSTTVTYNATDAGGNHAAPVTTVVNVVPSAPPSISTPVNPTTFNTVPGGAVTFTVTASDPDVTGVVTLGVAGLPAGASFPIPPAARPVSSTFSWTPTAPGSYSMTFTAIDNTGKNGAPVTVNINVAAPPPFSLPFNPPAGACICSPLLMNTNVNGTQHWYVKASAAGGPLTITASAVAVGPGIAETVLARIFDASTGLLVDSITASYTAPQAAPGFSADAQTTIGAAPGTVYRVSVSTPGGNPQQAHYRLKVDGADGMATGSPSSPSFEHDEVTWYFNVAPGEDLGVRVFTAGAPVPPTPAPMTFEYRLIKPDGTALPPVTLTGVATGFDQVISVPTADAGSWGLQVIHPSEHYRLGKTTGADRGIYMTWRSAGRGAATVRIATGAAGGPLFLQPVSFEVHNEGGQLVDSFGTADGLLELDDLDPGVYTVTLTSVPPGWSVVQPTFTVYVMCDETLFQEWVVIDNTPPTLVMPPSVTLEAVNAGGAPHSFVVTATDLADPDVTISCSATSGDLFPLGPGDSPLTTTVTCTATDDAGNVAEDSFTVTVHDTIAPALTPPASVTLEAASASGAVHTFVATALDDVDGDPAVVCTPGTGTTFALAAGDQPLTTTVECSATDNAGNRAEGEFTVTVRDTTAPSLTLPGNQILEATSAAGAPFSFTPLSSDTVDTSVAISCDVSSAGYIYPLGLGGAPGTTMVSCTATDNAGNSTSGSFTVTVRDTTAPLAACTPSFNPSTRNVPQASRQNEDGFYRVSGSDTVGAVTITLGSYTLQQGETVKFTQSPGTNGVVFVNSQGREPIRHFRVGPGDPVITVTDASGNVTTQTCYVPPIPK